MIHTSKFRLLPLVALLWLLWTGASAQHVTFNVAGINPHCYNDFPDGVPYNGFASVSFLGADIVSVTFQMQRLSGSSWLFIGAPFTISDDVKSSSVLYTQGTSGAPPLNVSPANYIRMKAVITYTLNGVQTTVTVYSLTVDFHYFDAPLLNYKINGFTVAPKVPTTIFLCTGTPTLTFVPTTSNFGTGKMWRLLVFNSTSTGGAVSPFGSYADCGWQTSPLPATIDLDDPFGNGCVRPLGWFGLNGEYLLVRIELKNDCGTTVKDGLVRVLPAPSGAAVNFAFLGSYTDQNPNTPGVQSADAYSDYGAGLGLEDEGDPIASGNPASSTDGLLSWGGTQANATWIGGFRMGLSNVAVQNLFGSIQTHTVKIDDVTDPAVPLPLGEEDFPGGLPIDIDLNQKMALGYLGDTKKLLFFFLDYNTLVGRTFRVTITGHGVCNQNPSKEGFFRLIPGGQFWFTDPGGNDRSPLPDIGASGVEERLEVSPNPARDQLLLRFEAAAASEGAVLRVVAMDGQEMLRRPGLSLSAGSNALTQDLSDLPPGTYAVQLLKAGGVFNRVFVKMD